MSPIAARNHTGAAAQGFCLHTALKSANDESIRRGRHHVHVAATRLNIGMVADWKRHFRKVEALQCVRISIQNST